LFGWLCLQHVTLPPNVTPVHIWIFAHATSACLLLKNKAPCWLDEALKQLEAPLTDHAEGGRNLFRKPGMRYIFMLSKHPVHLIKKIIKKHICVLMMYLHTHVYFVWECVAMLLHMYSNTQLHKIAHDFTWFLCLTGFLASVKEAWCQAEVCANTAGIAGMSVNSDHFWSSFWFSNKQRYLSKLISGCQRKGFTSLRLCLTWPYSCCCRFGGAVSSGRSGLRCELRANKSENKSKHHKGSRRERPQIDFTREDLPDSSRRMSKAAWFELGGGPKKANKTAEQKLLSLRKDMAQWSCQKHIWFSFT